LLTFSTVIPKPPVLTSAPVILIITVVKYTSPVTQKGQITIPKSLRDKLNISPYGQVTIEVEKNYIKVTPTKDVVDLAGFLAGKVTVKKDILEGRRAMEISYERV